METKQNNNTPFTQELLIQEYTFRFTVKDGKGYINILNGEGKTGDMQVNIIKMNDMVLTLKDMKKKMVDEEFSKPEYKDKYSFYEREVLKKEVIEDSRGETKL